MVEEGTVLQSEEPTNIIEQLKDEQQHFKDFRLLSGLNALVLIGLVAAVVTTFSFLLFGETMTDLEITLYKFSLLIGPSALFLLMLHLFELYGMTKQGKKSIPLTLDFMYFLYIGLAFPTMMGIHWYFQRHQIPLTFLTTGWSVLISTLCLEVPLALFLAKFCISMVVAPRLPSFFLQSRKAQRQTLRLPLLQQLPTRPKKQVFYFRKKANVTLWEHEDCFVRFNP